MVIGEGNRRGDGRREGHALTYLLVLYSGQGVDVLLETIPRLDCNEQNHTLHHALNTNRDSAARRPRCLHHVREREVNASRRDSRRARRDDANATHLVSPGPSGTA